eukprot:CAMPEP_0204917250 /NCGR_PEP_ID=MMETSP1397-20131031/14880_1 /ASSEMBLY_ACC=CAM_ASM_000891 /TAXON_ID=49980 /ORGANISM="Climacostomum Climacostomum virens, Strain Stock W-24" /LENGTH=206 /DNA_ID=CAMNT_0052090037 /DNA_START=82 /DNA_END=698 /DNA_ORIENTATION=-
MEGLHGAGRCTCHAELSDSDPFGQDLLPYIDTLNVTCLNEEQFGSCKSVFKTRDDKLDRDKSCKSNEGDPVLLMTVPFTCPVKLNSICVIGGLDGTSPSLVKAYANRQYLDFASADDLPPTQQFELIENPDGSYEYSTRVSKFMNVTQLQLYFPQNYGCNFMEITYLGFKGEATGHRNEAVIAIYESRPVVSDHKVKDSMGGAHIV